MNGDLLHPTFESEQSQHKLKRLVQSPDSYFMDVKCPGCNSIATIFSYAQNIMTCEGCWQVLSRPTGGKCKLGIGTSYRVKREN